MERVSIETWIWITFEILLNYFWQYIFQHTNDFIYTLAKILGFIKYSLTFYSFADFRSTELVFASVSSSKLNISIVLFSSSLIKLAKRVNCLSYTSADLDWAEPETLNEVVQ